MWGWLQLRLSDIVIEPIVHAHIHVWGYMLALHNGYKLLTRVKYAGRQRAERWWRVELHETIE